LRKIRLFKALPTAAIDATGVVGAALVAYGCYRIYQPAGLIVAGCMLIAIALILARGA
jgi:hypothetical protein